MVDIKDYITFNKENKEKDISQFIKIISYLHSIEIFHLAISVALSLCFKGRLTFNIATDSIKNNQNGLCETLCIPVYQKVLNKLQYKKKYQISVKEIKYCVIMHEIFHMIEKELEIDLQEDFIPKIKKDLANLTDANLCLRQKIKELFVEDLKLYKQSHYNSEVFARYFELFASVKEISAKGSFYLKDLTKIFKETENWQKSCLPNQMQNKISEQIKTFNKTIALKKLKLNKINWANKETSKKVDGWSNKVSSNFD